MAINHKLNTYNGRLYKRFVVIKLVYFINQLSLKFEKVITCSRKEHSYSCSLKRRFELLENQLESNINSQNEINSSSIEIYLSNCVVH